MRRDYTSDNDYNLSAGDPQHISVHQYAKTVLFTGGLLGTGRLGRNRSYLAGVVGAYRGRDYLDGRKGA